MSLEYHKKRTKCTYQMVDTPYLFDPVLDDRRLCDGDVLPGGGRVEVEFPQDLLLDVLLRHLLEESAVLSTSRAIACRCYLRCCLVGSEPSLRIKGIVKLVLSRGLNTDHK